MNQLAIASLCLAFAACQSPEASPAPCEERRSNPPSEKKEPDSLWKFNKVSAAEWAAIQKKLARIEQRAEYVRITEKSPSLRTAHTHTYPLSPDTKRALLEEWRSAGPWSERTSDRIIMDPAVFYRLEFLDEHQEVVAEVPMNDWDAGWYQPPGQSNYISVSDKIFSLFPDAE